MGNEKRGTAILDRARTHGAIAANNAALASNQTSRKPSKSTIAQQLIAIGEHAELFQDERGDGYAVVEDRSARRTLRLRGRDFRRWLCWQFYRDTGKAANGQAIAAALDVLNAIAAFNNVHRALSNRFAEHDGALWIDLCDSSWRAVKVTGEGWQVRDTAPTLFRRYSHQQPLPLPHRGGTLRDLRPFLNLRNDDEWHLVEAWLATAPFAAIPRPALTFHGPQGAAKSTAARVLKSLLDPSATDSVDLGRDPAALAQVLDHNALPCFDNLGRVPTWAADMLCRAVTGGAFSKRELYTDAEDVIFVFRRALLLTGINVPTHAPDLLDRMLLIELDRIPQDHRSDERAFWRRFDLARAGLFGALLDALVEILRRRETVRLERLPRMADFAMLACAYAEHTGVGTRTMIDILIANAGRQTEEVIESDPLAIEVREFAEEQRRWTGTASELHSALTTVRMCKARNEGWPKSADSLGRRLRVLQSTLAEVGVKVTFTKDPGRSRGRLIVLSAEDRILASKVSEVSEANGKAPRGADATPGGRPHGVREASTGDVSSHAALNTTDASDTRCLRSSIVHLAEGDSAVDCGIAYQPIDVEVPL